MVSSHACILPYISSFGNNLDGVFTKVHIRFSDRRLTGFLWSGRLNFIEAAADSWYNRTVSAILGKEHVGLEMKKENRALGILLLTAAIWGFAFTAQKTGAAVKATMPFIKDTAVVEG